MTTLRRVALVVLVAIVLGGGAWVARARSASPTRSALPALVRGATGPRAPAGVRIRVQVLNTTRTRGLARQATRLLRDRGFDVVEMGTTGPPAESTLVLDRSGHPDWSALVAAALGGASVRARPDSSRYLDATVLLGRAWRAPPQPLYP